MKTDLEIATEVYRAALAAHDKAYMRGHTNVLRNVTGPALSEARRKLRLLEEENKP
jgi:hypothetical protein